jgi:alpha-galactosidase
MDYTLENQELSLVVYPERAKWVLIKRDYKDFTITSWGAGICYAIAGRKVSMLHSWKPREIKEIEKQSSSHGALRMISMNMQADENGVAFQLDMALPRNTPMMLWKMQVFNRGQEPIQVERFEFLNTSPLTGDKYSGSFAGLKSPRFFSNGWGSWDYTTSYGVQDRYRRTWLGPLTVPMRKNPGTPHPFDRGHFVSDQFGVLGDSSSGNAWLVGFLSQRDQFGTIEAWLKKSPPVLRMWANGDSAVLSVGASMSTDWACLNFLNVNDNDPLRIYLEAVAREHEVKYLSSDVQNKQIPTGWCSWYEFGPDINQDVIEKNLDTMTLLREELPLNILQIDDGYQMHVGDWLDIKTAFPQGLAPLAREIHDSRLVPGLWLAPFIVDPRSRVAKEHPEWLVRGRLGRPANAGFSSWGTFTRGLDLTHPEALDYVRNVIRTATHEWGYSYLKLDFLYAGALSGKRYDPSLTLAQVLRKGLKAIRDSAGKDTFLVGCGCPLGSAIGLVDAMRIGPDVDSHWLPDLYGFGLLLKKEPGLPSTRYAINNTLLRAGFHKRLWINDPDCLLLRPDMELTLPEIQSLATAITLSGGSLLLSEDLPNLPYERLRIARCMLPLIGKRPQVLDWFTNPEPTHIRLDLQNDTGEWYLLARFNWEEREKEIRIDFDEYGFDTQTDYLVREFWRGNVFKVGENKPLVVTIPAHGVCLMSVREDVPGATQYVGGSLHISQGLEVVSWAVDRRKAVCDLIRPGQEEGEVVIKLSKPVGEAMLNGVDVAYRCIDGDLLYSFQVEFNQQGKLEIHFN